MHIILDKIESMTTQFEKILLSLFLSLVIGITFWGVLDRFVFKLGSIWVEELARYSSVWAAFIGAGLGVKTGSHIGIEAFVTAIPEKWQKIFVFIVNLLCFIFCVSITVIGYNFLLKLAHTHQLAPATRIPVWWAYAAVPGGCSLMSLHYGVNILRTVLYRFKLAGKG